MRLPAKEWKPNAKEIAWFNHYLETGDDKAAVKLVWPNAGDNAKNPSNCLAARAANLKRRFASQIPAMLQTRMSYDSVAMVNKLRSLALDADSENVSLSAVNSWLDRSGITKDSNSNAGIAVTITRDSIKVESGNQRLSVNTDTLSSEETGLNRGTNFIDAETE